MNWDKYQIYKTCLETQSKDPKESPNDFFLYVDISSIDRNLKIISNPSEILGMDAPSRAKKQICNGDVLVSTVRPNLNAVAIVPPELDDQVASTGFCVLRPNRSVLIGKFLFYFTTTNYFVSNLSKKVRGAHYPAVSDSNVKEINIPLPTISEQRQIVEILDQADALYKKRVEADNIAERIIPTLFYKMFGDIKKNTKKFDTDKLGNIIRFKSGNSLTASNMKREGKYPVYGGNGITGYHDKYMFEKPKIIIGRVGAYCGIVHFSEPNIWVTDNALYVSEYKKNINEYFLFSLLQTMKLNQYAGRAGQPLVSGNRLYPLNIIQPPSDLQDEFERKRLEIERIISNKNEAINKINLLYKTLLFKAYSGKLTAKWREAHMEELLREMEIQAQYLNGAKI